MIFWHCSLYKFIWINKFVLSNAHIWMYYIISGISALNSKYIWFLTKPFSSAPYYRRIGYKNNSYITNFSYCVQYNFRMSPYIKTLPLLRGFAWVAVITLYLSLNIKQYQIFICRNANLMCLYFCFVDAIIL